MYMLKRAGVVSLMILAALFLLGFVQTFNPNFSDVGPFRVGYALGFVAALGGVGGLLTLRIA